MSQENVEIARRAAEAAIRRPKPDVETLNALFHPEHEFVSITSVLDGRRWRGAFGFRDFLNDFDESMDWLAEVQSATEIDRDRVLLEVAVTARGKSSDLALRTPRVAVMTLRDGKVARTETYPSRAEALEAAGLPE